MAVKRVFCAGTFDGIHPGHLKFLQYAKKFGGEVWVVVAREESALKVRGHAPLFDENNRLKLVRALRIVDKAVLGSRKSWFEAVREADPEVIVLGHDQQIDLPKLKEFVQRWKLKTRRIVRAPQFERSKNRSSRLRNEKPGFEKQL